MKFANAVEYSLGCQWIVKKRRIEQRVDRLRCVVEVLLGRARVDAQRHARVRVSRERLKRTDANLRHRIGPVGAVLRVVLLAASNLVPLTEGGRMRFNQFTYPGRFQTNVRGRTA